MSALSIILDMNQSLKPGLRFQRSAMDILVAAAMVVPQSHSIELDADRLGKSGGAFDSHSTITRLAQRCNQTKSHTRINLVQKRIFVKWIIFENCSKKH